MMRVFHTSAYSQEEVKRIADLAGFDADYYHATYPDVADAGVDPVRHFLDQGIAEIRFPAPRSGVATGGRPASGLAEVIGFDPVFYAATYPDTAADPLGHFFAAGLRERRLPFSLEANSAAERMLWRVLDRHRIVHAGSLEAQSQFVAEGWIGIADDLLAAARRGGVVCRPYRNNFWLAVGLGFLADGRFGLAACCYNFFFHYYLPLVGLGNGEDRVVVTGRLVPTVDVLTRAVDPPAGGRRKRRATSVVPIAETVKVVDPTFLNRIAVVRPPIEATLPLPAYGTLSDVELIGGASLILQANHVVLYDYVDQDPLRPREPQCPNLIHVVGDACAVHFPARGIEVDEAFSLLHDHSHNYHHWLLEVLPRYLLAREVGLGADVPLLVEQRLAPQKRELLGIVFAGSPPLIELEQGSAVRVRLLHWMSDLCRNSVHTETSPEPTDILFSPTAIALLRAVAAPYLSPEGAAPSGSRGRVLVLRRNVTFRRLVNRAMLEDSMRDLGFWGFDAGSASWVDQVRVFSNASLIVAEAGAALANLVFCRPGATIVVLVNGHANSNYFYLAQLAGLVGARLFFFECLRLAGSHTIGVQDDMIVPIGTFVAALQRLADDPPPQTLAGRRKSLST
jgi:hypothetical protein